MKKLYLLFVLTLLPLVASAADNKCGDKLTYSYDSSTETLTISGTGDMYSYDVYGTEKEMPPFPSAKHLVVEYGVTSIGFMAFWGQSSLLSVYLPSTLTKIGKYSFYFCSSLKTVVSEIKKPFEINMLAFDDLPSNAELIVLKGTKDKYKAAGGWDDFSKITEVSNADMFDNNIFYKLKSDGALEVCGFSPTASKADIPSSFTRDKKYRVTSIAEGAFEGRSNIKYLSIPYSMKSIGKNAFKSCGSSISVNIADPESWCKMELGNEYASPLACAGKLLVLDKETTYINFPETVSSINAFTFFGCRPLTSISTPGSVKSIGSSAFEGCEKLGSVIINNGLESIGGSAFEGCGSLTMITFPSSVNTIKVNAFKNCTGIKDVFCEATTVPKADATSFDGLPSNAKLRVPQGTKDKYKAAEGWKRFTDIVEMGAAWNYFEVANADGVTIYYHGVKGSSEVEVTYKGDDDPLDFYDYYKGKVVIPETVKYEGKTYKVTGINHDSFQQCANLTSVIIPNSVTTIGDGAFVACSKLYSIVIPKNVTSIGKSAFRFCKMLTNVVSEVEKPFAIDDDVFDGISSTATLIVPKGTVDKYKATNGWKKFSRIVEGTKYITYYSFEKPNADGVTIYYRWTKWGTAVEVSCKGDDSLDFLDEYTGDVVIPESVEYDGKTFSVVGIGMYAFHQCSKLTSVTIPKSVTSIEDGAFAACNKLATIISKIEKPFAIDKNVFELISSNVKLMVPKGTKALYQATEGWNVVKNIIEDGGEGSEFEIDGIRYYIGLDNTVTIVDCDAKLTGDLVIPKEVKYNGTTYTVSVGWGAFSGRTGIKSVTFAEGVKWVEARAFSGCSGLTSVTIPSSLVLLGDCAFNGCTKLANVYISDLAAFLNINFEIDEGATSNPLYYAQHLFLNGKEIKDIVIPNSVKTIKRNAFGGFKGLNSVTIPDGVTTIEDRAFLSSGLTSVNIPNSVTSIGWSAFNNCSSLAKVVSEIKKPFAIDNSVFEGLPSKAELRVPIGTKAQYQATEGWNVFTNIIEDGGVGSEFEMDGIRYRVGLDNTVTIVDCDAKLTGDLVIPKEVKYNGTSYEVSVGWGAFSGCTGLKSVTISEGVTWVDALAFSGCSGLTSVTIPSSLGHFGDCAFDGCTKLANVYISDLAAFLNINFEVDEGATSNPLYFAQHLFLNGKEIKDIVIPNSIKTIKRNALGGFKGLNSVTIPNGVTTIEDRAFLSSGLTSVNIPNSVASIGWSAFNGCSNLATVVSDIEKPFAIDKTVFEGLPSNAELRVPKDTKAQYQATEGWNVFTNITEDGEDAKFETDGILYLIGMDDFVSVVSGETKYTGDVTIPKEVKHEGKTYKVKFIDPRAFEGCKDMTSVTIPSSVEEIGWYAFGDCTGLTSITLPEGLTWIDARAFAGCSNLTSLTIPRSMIYIDDCAFDGCSQLSDVHISDLADFLNIEFVTDEGPTSNPLYYARHLFLNEEEIKDLEIPNSVTKIKKNAFLGFKGLNSVTIPNSVTSIGSLAFSGCTGLRKVDCLAEDIPTMDDNAFDGVWETATLRVHYDKEDAYKQTSPWSKFSTITHLPVIVYMIDGEVYDRVESSYGATIVPPVVEQREGYEFAWGNYPETMPDEDVTIEGSYVATAINGVKAEAADADIYSISGYRTSKLQRGLNIIRQSDGKVRKVLVK